MNIQTYVPKNTYSVLREMQEEIKGLEFQLSRAQDELREEQGYE